MLSLPAAAQNCVVFVVPRVAGMPAWALSPDGMGDTGLGWDSQYHSNVVKLTASPVPPLLIFHFHH